MKRHLDMPDDIIAIRVATRFGLNKRAAELEGQIKTAALREHARSELRRAGLDPSLVDTAPGLVAGFRKTFVPPAPDSPEMTEPRALRAQADETLTMTLISEDWPPGCGCVLSSLFLETAPEEGYQTFAATTCDAHAGLSLEQLRDAHDREVLLRHAAAMKLAELDPDRFDGKPLLDMGITWRWEGSGAERKLVVVGDDFTPEMDAALCALADNDAITTSATAARRAANALKG